MVPDARGESPWPVSDSQVHEDEPTLQRQSKELKKNSRARHSQGKVRNLAEGPLAIICRELIVNVCCGDCGMSESHTQLMQISNDVSCGVKTWYRCSLMVVDDEITSVRARGSQRRGKVGLSCTSKCGINSIKFMTSSAFGHDADPASWSNLDLPRLIENHHVRRGEGLARIGTPRRFANCEN